MKIVFSCYFVFLYIFFGYQRGQWTGTDSFKSLSETKLGERGCISINKKKYCYYTSY